MTRQSEDDVKSYASPACSMHEADPVYTGLSDPNDHDQQVKLANWRKAERARLIKDRMAIPAESRHQYDKRIQQKLLETIRHAKGQTVSLYWPFRGEPNLNPTFKRLQEQGAQCALPVVLEQDKPLVFRSWSAGEPLEPGVLNIPIPKEGAAMVEPDIIIAPVIGFDKSCYRLGYGGGFYDRTLSALSKKPRAIGVGYSIAQISTIKPQWYDVPLDVVISEEGLITPGRAKGGLP